MKAKVNAPQVSLGKRSGLWRGLIWLRGASAEQVALNRAAAAAPDKYVTKLFYSAQAAADEYAHAALTREVDPEGRFSVPPVTMCSAGADLLPTAFSGCKQAMHLCRASEPRARCRE